VKDVPDTNPKSRYGVAKPGISAIPPVAILHCGLGMQNGVEKYGLFNWREHEVSASVYYNAAARHLMAWWEGEREAQDSGVHHLGHVMACCAILLDAEEQGMLNDDRPENGADFQAIVDSLTEPLDGPEGEPTDLAESREDEDDYDPTQMEPIDWDEEPGLGMPGVAVNLDITEEQLWDSVAEFLTEPVGEQGRLLREHEYGLLRAHLGNLCVEGYGQMQRTRLDFYMMYRRASPDATIYEMDRAFAEAPATLDSGSL